MKRLILIMFVLLSSCATYPDIPQSVKIRTVGITQGAAFSSSILYLTSNGYEIKLSDPIGRIIVTEPKNISFKNTFASELYESVTLVFAESGSKTVVTANIRWKNASGTYDGQPNSAAAYSSLLDGLASFCNRNI